MLVFIVVANNVHHGPNVNTSYRLLKTGSRTACWQHYHTGTLNAEKHA